jgi:hypothetical protein
MTSLRPSARFQQVVEQTLAILKDRGLDVVPVAVEGALEGTLRFVAEQSGMRPSEVLRYTKPETLADRIAAEADSDQAHSIRLARNPGRISSLPMNWTGRLVMGLAQASKYASANGDNRTVDHISDLLTEIGSAMYTGGPDAQAIAVDEGVFNETCDLLRAVARHIDDDGWSICPCGQDHDQSQTDTKVPQVLRMDAELARAVGSDSFDPVPDYPTG